MRPVSIIVALVMAVLAAVVMVKFFGGGKKSSNSNIAETQTVERISILVARKNIPVGTAITSDHIDAQDWPATLKLDNFITADKASEILGLVTRANYQVREPLIKSKLANKNDPSFLAANLTEGMRAVSIKVNETSAIAGFVFPGDRVDLLARYEIKRDVIAYDSVGRPSNKEKVEPVAELIASNVKVIAVGQKSEHNTEEGIKVPRSVTVEVGREDAQKILLAQKLGNVSLALRSINEGPLDQAPMPTTIETMTNLSLHNTKPPKLPAGIRRNSDVRIVRGVKVFGDDKEPNKNFASPNPPTHPQYR